PHRRGWAGPFGQVVTPSRPGWRRTDRLRSVERSMQPVPGDRAQESIGRFVSLPTEPRSAEPRPRPAQAMPPASRRGSTPAVIRRGGPPTGELFGRADAFRQPREASDGMESAAGLARLMVTARFPGPSIAQPGVAVPGLVAYGQPRH